MNQSRQSLISCFLNVPHAGLEAILGDLQSHGVALDQSSWELRVAGEYPHAFYRSDGHFGLAVGVTRKPMVGYVSWCALTDGPHGERRPLTIRVVIDDRNVCSVEYDPGSHVWSEEMRSLVSLFFADRVYSVALDHARRPALLERFCELAHRRS